MQNTYDKLKDFAWILGDHDPDFAEEDRNHMRGVVITGTDGGNRPVFDRVPYILRSMVHVDPDKKESKHGSFSMAMPAIVVDDGAGNIHLRVLSSSGIIERKLGLVFDWQLPTGGQDVAPGIAGILVVGTETKSEQKIFFPSGNELIANHRGQDATEGSTLVSDLASNNTIGLQARLAKAIWVCRTPTFVDSQARNTVALNAYSQGTRSGSAVEHQGGAIVLYNSNVRSIAPGDRPRIVTWAAWLDDGPWYDGLGARDMHIKGIDPEGIPHLPLMFHRDRAKFGPGAFNTPAAPLDFLDIFASPPRVSAYIYRAAIVYDRSKFHPNPSGVNRFVQGRWVVEYRLPHQQPHDDDAQKKEEDAQAKEQDPNPRKTESQKKHDPVGKTDSGPKSGDPSGRKGRDSQTKNETQTKEDTQSKKTGDPLDKSSPTYVPYKPGPGSTGGGPGTCGQPGEPPQEPGPGDGPPDGVGGCNVAAAQTNIAFSPADKTTEAGKPPAEDGGSKPRRRGGAVAGGLPFDRKRREAQRKRSGLGRIRKQDPQDKKTEALRRKITEDAANARAKDADRQDKKTKANNKLKQKQATQMLAANAVTGQLARPQEQANISGPGVASGANGDRIVSHHGLRMPLRSHMQVGYPSIVGIVASEQDRLEFEPSPSNTELEAIDRHPINSTQIMAWGDQLETELQLRQDRDRKTVRGGFVVAGSDIRPHELYEAKASSLIAILALRPEASIEFGHITRNGGVESPAILKDDRATGEFFYVRRKDPAGTVDLDYFFHFKSPLQLTKVTTAERLSIFPTDGVVVLDTDLNKVFIRIDSAWVDITGNGDVTSSANITDHTIVRGDGGAKGVQDTSILIDDDDNLDTPGYIKSNDDAGGIGYAEGAGGAVTQVGSKGSTVTINKITGEITMDAGALGAGNEVTFLVNNTSMSANDSVIANVKGGATGKSYITTAHTFSAGNFFILLGNMSVSSLSEAVVIRFTIIKGAIA